MLVLPAFLFILGMLLEMNSNCLNSASLSRTVLHTGFTAAVVMVLMFVAGIVDCKLPRLLIAFMVVFALISPVIAGTNESHFLFYSYVSFDADATLPSLVKTLGPFGFINRAFALVCLLAALGILICRLRATSGENRRSAIWLLAGITVLIAALALYTFHFHMNLGILAMTVFSVIAAVIIYKHNIYEIVDIEESSLDSFMSRVLYDAPVLIKIWNEDIRVIWCSKKVLEVFGLASKDDYDLGRTSPEYQPCGRPSATVSGEIFKTAFSRGFISDEYIHILPDGTEMPIEFTGIRFEYEEKRYVVTYQLDLRKIKTAMEREKASNEMLRTIFNTAPYVIAVSEEDGTIISLNTKTKELFGIEDPMEISRLLNDFSPEFQPCGTPTSELAEAWFAKANKNNYARFNWMHKDPDGNEMPVEWIYIFIEIAGKRQMLSYAMDVRRIVNMKKSEDDAFKFANDIIDFAPVIITLWDKHDNLVRVSANVTDIFGIDDPFDFINRFDEFSPEYQPCGMLSSEKKSLNFKEVMSTGYHSFDWVHLRSDGTPMYCDIVAKVVRMNNMDMVLMCNRDVTEIRHAHKKIDMEVTRSKLMLDAAPILIQYWDEKYNCLDCNLKTLEFYGCETKEEYIQNAESFTWEKQPDGSISWDVWTSFLGDVFRDKYGKITFTEKGLLGNEVIFDIVGFHVEYGGVRVVITYSTDITSEFDKEIERRRARAAEENSMAKSNFLATMSHEIRTPLTAIMGTAEIMLKKPGLNLLAEEAFFTVQKSANQLQTIINDILDFSKIEAGSMDIKHEQYETTSLVSDSVASCLVNLDLEGKDIKFLIDVDENLPAYLIGDLVRIEQIINNLLSNAFKYTLAGEVIFFLSFNPGYKNEPREDYVTLIITVRDTGMGMTKSQVEKINQVYTRFHDNNRHIQGTGLGMPIVYNLCNMMDAEIAIDSEVDVGTTVTISIPQKVTGVDVVGKETALQLQRFEINMDIASKQFNFTPESMPYGKVLIVDDVDANLHVARGLMEFYDLDIDIAESGFIAIDKIKQGNIYDIIFMDHMMPIMDGTETLQLIRAQNYTGPVVVLTANAIIGQAEKFLNDGFDGYLSKPIQTKNLNNILAKFIKEKQTPEVLAKAAERSRQNANRLKKGNIHDFQHSPEVLGKLRRDFALEQRGAVAELRQMLENTDSKNALLLAHTLKGRAALIMETALSNVAEAAERSLRAGEIPSEDILAELENELNYTLAGIAETGKFKPKALLSADGGNRDKALELLTALKPMLEERKNDAKRHLGELRNIPEAAIFVRQIEKFDFASALKTMPLLRNILEESRL